MRCSRMASKYALNVSLTEHLCDFVASQVATGRFGTSSEVVRAALRLLERDLNGLASSAHRDGAKVSPAVTSREDGRSSVTGADARNFPIVGIGASAGGVEALEGFFSGMPSKPGLGFVVVTHLSPDRESMLHQIVAR